MDEIKVTKMNEKIKFILQVLAVVVPTTILVSCALLSPMGNNYINPLGSYSMNCRNPQPLRDFSVFKGAKVVEVVCLESPDFFRQFRYALNEDSSTNGELMYWSRVRIAHLIKPESESFFCSSERELDNAYIYIDFIPLAQKSNHPETPKNSVQMTDQIYLQSWEIRGFENSHYWQYGHPLQSSIAYIYEQSAEPVRNIIESNVAQLYRASMELTSGSESFKAKLKCIQHPMDV